MTAGIPRKPGMSRDDLLATNAKIVTSVGEQIKATTPEYALYGFAIFYGVCIIINWWFYLRPGAYVKNP